MTVAQNHPLWRLMSAFGATQYAPLVVLATQEEEEEEVCLSVRPSNRRGHSSIVLYQHE